jgi:predicted transcriptional regulator
MVNLAITENVKDIDVDGENDENNESEEVWIKTDSKVYICACFVCTDLMISLWFYSEKGSCSHQKTSEKMIYHYKTLKFE